MHFSFKIDTSIDPNDTGSRNCSLIQNFVTQSGLKTAV